MSGQDGHQTAGRIGGGCVVSEVGKAALSAAASPAALAACLVILFAGTAGAAELKARPRGDKVPVRSCVIPPLDLVPIYAAPEPAEDNGDDDDEEDDDDDEEDGEDEDDDETVRGMLDPTGSTCVALSGEATGSMQGAWFGLPAGIGTRSRDTSSLSVTSTLTLTTLSTLADGTQMRSSFGMLAQPNPGAEAQNLQIVEAFAGIAGWNAGYGASTFNFWSGDDFLFGARIPARSAQQLSHAWQITEGWSAQLSVENSRSDSSVQRPALLQPLPGLRWPDVVARTSYWSETLQFHLAGALAERPVPDGKPSQVGKAAIVGATYASRFLGSPHRLTLQVAGAIGAPRYLGTQVDAPLLTALVDVGDATRGFSALVASSRDWTDRLSTNVYASMLRLDFSTLGARSGRAEIWRGAANIVFSPVKGMRFGLEGGLSRAHVDLPNRIIPADLSSRQKTAILWFSRSF